MSIDLMSKIWRSDLPKDEKYIALCLADHGNDEGEGIYPSHHYLSWKTGYSTSSLRKILYSLRDKEIINIDVQGSKYGTNSYSIIIENIPTRLSYRSPDRENRDVDEGVPTGEHPSSSGSGGVPTGEHPRVPTGEHLGCPPVNTVTVSEPSVEPSVNPADACDFEEPHRDFRDLDDPEWDSSISAEENFERIYGDGNRNGSGKITPDNHRDKVIAALKGYEDRTGANANQEIENYLTRVPECDRALAHAFCYCKGRAPRTDTEDKFWRKCWRDQSAIGITPGQVKSAYEHMVENQLSIKSPGSVTAIAENLKDGQPLARPNVTSRYTELTDSSGRSLL